MKSAGAILILSLLTACTGSHSVAYYKAHSDVREERVRECVTFGNDSQDCRNAKQAQLELYGIPALDGTPILSNTAATGSGS